MRFHEHPRTKDVLTARPGLAFLRRPESRGIASMGPCLLSSWINSRSAEVRATLWLFPGFLSCSVPSFFPARSKPPRSVRCHPRRAPIMLGTRSRPRRVVALRKQYFSSTTFNARSLRLATSISIHSLRVAPWREGFARLPRPTDEGTPAALRPEAAAIADIRASI